MKGIRSSRRGVTEAESGALQEKATVLLLGAAPDPAAAAKWCFSRVASQSEQSQAKGEG